MVSLQIAYSAGPDLPPHQPSGGSPQQSRPPRESGRGAARPWLWTATPRIARVSVHADAWRRRDAEA